MDIPETLGSIERDVEETKLAKSRIAIIKSILRGGLKSATRLEKESISHLKSNDEEANKTLFWRNFSPYLINQRAIMGALYSNPNSVLPVLMERNSDEELIFFRNHTDEEKKLLETRVRSSVMLVFK